MKHEDFNKLLDKIIKRTTNVLASKSSEYASDKDKFYNFKRASVIANESPERALWGMALKHLVSIIDIVEKIDKDKQYPDKDKLEEKICDMINYLILLEGLIKEEGNL